MFMSLWFLFLNYEYYKQNCAKGKVVKTGTKMKEYFFPDVCSLVNDL